MGTGKGGLQEVYADHEVCVRVTESLPEELPFEGFGEAFGVIFHRLDEPSPLRSGEERCVLGILGRV